MIRLKTRRYPIIVLFCLSLLLPGCAGMREIDEAAYILALGLDRGPGGNIVASVVVGNAVAAGRGQGGGENEISQAVRVFSASAPSLFAGLSLINTVLERQINPTHLKLIVFSADLARAGVGEHLDTFARWRQFRRTVYLSVTPGRAQDVMESLVPSIQENPGKFLEMMVATQSFVGYTPLRQMLQFYNAYKTKGESPIAIMVSPRTNLLELAQTKDAAPVIEIDPRSAVRDPGALVAGQPPIRGNGPLQFMGTAVFERDRMVGVLDANQSLALAIMRGEMQRSFITVPDPREPGKDMQIELSRLGRPRVRVKRHGGVTIREDLYLQGEVAGIQAQEAYETPERIEWVERAVMRWVLRECRRVFREAQSLGTDVFGFGDRARWLVPDWPAWQQWDWQSDFRQARLDLRVKIQVDRTGLIIEKNAVREE